MRKVLIGVLIAMVLAGLGVGRVQTAQVRQDCDGGNGSRLAKVVGEVTDVVGATSRGRFCPPREPHPASTVHNVNASFT